MKISITKVLIFINFILWLKPENHIISNYILFNPSKSKLSEPLNFIIPYFSHNDPLSFLLGMMVFNYIGNILEILYKPKTYIKILLLSLCLINILAIILSLIFKNLFEYPLFYYSSYMGFVPIILSLRYLYFNILDRPLYVYGFLIHSKNIIWIELLILNIFRVSQSFYIHLAGILAGRIIYNILPRI